jgi:diaminopimelate epimerase
LKLAFTKVEGLGNDFALVDVRGWDRDDADDLLAKLVRRAPQICDRRRGIGGDGILVVTDASLADAAARMVVINRDGSRPEMCGNGIRCVALFLTGVHGGATTVIETDAGPRRCTVTTALDATNEDRPTDGALVEVDMGIGTSFGAREIAGRSFHAVSVGNPHAVAFVDEDPEQLALALGPYVERDPVFVGGTNVEFVRIHDRHHATVWVWERGCGVTQACGTGACATAFAGCELGQFDWDTPIEVQLPGGLLTITIARDGAQISMVGPAQLVFRGAIDL